jgi:hypothetical protein
LHGRDAVVRKLDRAKVRADSGRGIQRDELEALDLECLRVHETPDNPSVLGACRRVDDVDPAPAGDERRDAFELPTAFDLARDDQRLSR